MTAWLHDPKRLRLVRVHSVWGKLCGLWCRPPPGARVGLWLTSCRCIHTFGMRYAIDVAFVSRQGRVVQWTPGLPPGRVALCLRAVAVVELRVGVIDIEHGGIGRIEAAIQYATGNNVDRNLQRPG
jgi:hypothetical protein